MAALASRVSQGPGLASVKGSVKLLAVAPCNNKVSKANIYSKSSGMLEERVKPWNYTKWGYNSFFALFDGTTKRFNDNSKLICIEGPPALGKTKLAEELADELDMKYIPGISMEDFYINKYGYDLRELDHLFKHPKLVSFDEKKFAQNPTGQDGGVDRMVTTLFYIRFRKYIEALAHIFNTGQGVVMEKSVYSDYVFVDTAYEMGWLDRTTRIYLNKIKKQMLFPLLRPHLILYLDAPVDVVQSKIRARAATTHPWEKNSPVYENTAYLNLLYEDKFKSYIKAASANSRVLMYDWSEGGDTEVVVEDIERLNLDYFDKYDPLCKDWRMHKEENYTRKRLEVTDVEWNLRNSVTDYYRAEKLVLTPEESIEFQSQAFKVPGNRHMWGLNATMGESVALRFGSFIGTSNYEAVMNSPYYHLDVAFIDNDEYNEWAKRSQDKKAKGEEKWWQF